MTQIDYFYYSASPFTYLGHEAIAQVARKHNAKLNYKPIDLFAVWEVSGAVPPAKRSPVRQRYRLLELQRVADIRGLEINIKPLHWPVDTSLADCCTIALIEKGEDPHQYAYRVLAGVWAHDVDMSDENQIALCLESEGFDAAEVLALAKSDAVKRLREINTQEAIASDAVGVPAYVVDGEVYWGQDRIEYIDHTLTTGRRAFSAV